MGVVGSFSHVKRMEVIGCKPPHENVPKLPMSRPKERILLVELGRERPLQRQSSAIGHED